MASLRLPDRLRKNLHAIATSSDEAVEELFQTLSAVKANIPTEDIPDNLAGQLKTWDKDRGRDVVVALISLCSFRANSGQSAEVLVDDVLSTLRKAPEGEKVDPTLVLPTELADVAKKRLVRLLRIPAFDVAAKALGVHTDHLRAFVASRILSDIRPVFSEDIQSRPTGAVLVHSLKIEFMESGERKQFFVALDSSDLELMSEVLSRAKQKDLVLRKILADSDMQLLEPK